MNKSAFFDQLKKSLAGLSPEEREDILRDMEEHFYEAGKRGLSEEEIVEKLGSPKKISETIIAEAKVKRISQATNVTQKTTAILAAMLAILVLTPFSFLFILIPLFIIGALLCSFWPVALVLTGTLPLILLALGLLMFQVGFNLIALLCLLFFALGWSSMVLAVILGLSIVTLCLFQGLAKLFQWHIDFIKKQMRD